MGSEAACTASIDGRTARGTALLEQKELIFRGPFRLAIPLATITSAVAVGDRLDLQHAGGVASLTVGACATRWAHKIMHPPSRLQKLGVKAPAAVLLVGAFDEAFESDVKASGARLLRRAAAGSADLLFFAAGDRAALDRLGTLVGFLAPSGALWVIRPKGQRGITEADVLRAGRAAGLVDVKVVSFSETHTAEKFVIPVARRRSGAAVPRASRRRRSSSGSRRA